MVKIDYEERIQLEADAYAAYARAKGSNLPGRTFPAALTRNQNDIININDEILKAFLKEFQDGAIYYKVNYTPEFNKLKEVIFIDTDNYGFLGDVSKDGSVIRLNSELLKYPNLARIVFLRQMGKLYTVKSGNKHSHEIMSPCWDLDEKHEVLAKRIRTHPEQRSRFFLLLADEKPLEKRL